MGAVQPDFHWMNCQAHCLGFLPSICKMLGEPVERVWIHLVQIMDATMLPVRIVLQLLVPHGPLHDVIGLFFWVGDEYVLPSLEVQQWSIQGRAGQLPDRLRRAGGRRPVGARAGRCSGAMPPRRADGESKALAMWAPDARWSAPSTV